VVEGRYEGLNLTPPEEGFELYRHKNADNTAMLGMGRSPDAIIAGEQGGRARREYVPYSYLVGWGGVSTIRRIRTVGEKG
jgi:hypothetical protein